MKRTCENCEYFEKDGMEKGKHLCVLKEMIVRITSTCSEHQEK